jgi:methylase of polypeptide subunit release factors
MQLFAHMALLAALKERNYRFITPTPATHARIIARKSEAQNLRDVFGWSLPFAPELLDAELLERVQSADCIEERGDLVTSNVRVSSLDDILFLHSAYPTEQQDSVFFGPDSYRFADFLKRELPRFNPRTHIVDIGAGSGVGGIIASRLIEDANISFTDINPLARDYVQANAIHARITGETLFYAGDGLDQVRGRIDCVIANPPYIIDAKHRAYRDGGARHGAAISLDWARQAAERLEPDGVLLLYTGSAIIDGEDEFKTALFETLAGFDINYREIDPDVFGEELDRDAYANVERIAVVGVVAVKR